MLNRFSDIFFIKIRKGCNFKNYLLYLLSQKLKTMNVIKLDYDFGEAVYLKTDKQQMERLVTAISIRPDGVKYGLSCGMDESFHYGFEFTKDRDILKATSD